jgi:ankyrin repeat protein
MSNFLMASQQPALHAAVEEDDASAIARLAEDGENIDHIWQGETALHLACRERKLTCVRALVEVKADVNILTEHRNESPVFLACKEGQLEMVQLLIENGSSVHSNKGSGMSAMQAACRYGCSKVLKYLIQQGVDVNSVCPNNQTPLTLATQHGHRQAVNILLEAGTFVNVIDGQGNSPLFMAVMYQHIDLAEKFLKHGADVDIYNSEFQACPLHIAASNGDLDMVQTLVAGNCDVNAVQDQGQTALYISAEIGFLDVTECLLAAGAEPDVSTLDNENTAIFAALEKPSLTIPAFSAKPINEIVRTLIQAGCDVDHENTHGQLPLQVALDRHLCEVALMLLSAECSIRSECWFTSEMDFYIISLENNCPALYTSFVTELKNPRSLKRICRACIRSCLSWKRPYSKTVLKLPLPKYLQDFLQFKNLALM